MEDVKHWYLSKTIWGAVLAMVASILQVAGLQIGLADQSAIADAAVSIAGALGSILAVYGRITATAAIKAR